MDNNLTLTQLRAIERGLEVLIETEPPSPEIEQLAADVTRRIEKLELLEARSVDHNFLKTGLRRLAIRAGMPQADATRFGETAAKEIIEAGFARWQEW